MTTIEEVTVMTGRDDNVEAHWRGEDDLPYVITENGCKLYEGDRAYNFYDHEIVVIEKIDDTFQHSWEGNRKAGLWFTARTEHTTQVRDLNGERIITLGKAVQMKFIKGYDLKTTVVL